MKAVFDSNILIDYLNGIPEANEAIRQYPTRFISIITWMEVLVGCNTHEIPIVKQFLSQFECIELDQKICEQAVHIRQTSKIKLPDAIIWATAQILHGLLITRNTKDFPASHIDIVCPYTL